MIIKEPMEFPIVGLSYNDWFDTFSHLTEAELTEKIYRYSIELDFEEGNVFDENAIAVYFIDSKKHKVGYVCKLAAKFIATMFKESKHRLKAEISTKTKPCLDSKEIFITVKYE